MGRGRPRIRPRDSSWWVNRPMLTAAGVRSRTRQSHDRTAAVADPLIDVVRSRRSMARALTVMRESSMDMLMNDLRFATRVLWRHPLFTVTAAVSIAVGIGADAT